MVTADSSRSVGPVLYRSRFPAELIPYGLSSASLVGSSFDLIRSGCKSKGKVFGQVDGNGIDVKHDISRVSIGTLFT